MDDVYAKLIGCHKQLHAENILITAQADKLRYLGKDKPVHTLRELIQYHHHEQYIPKIKESTAKNYSATEKYLYRFIKKKFNATDVKLALVNYSFIIHL